MCRMAVNACRSARWRSGATQTLTRNPACLLLLGLILAGCSAEQADNATDNTGGATHSNPASPQQQAQYAFALNALQDDSAAAPNPALAGQLPQNLTLGSALDAGPAFASGGNVDTLNPIILQAARQNAADNATDGSSPAAAVVSPSGEPLAPAVLIEPQSTAVSSVEQSVAGPGRRFESYSTPGFSATLRADGSAELRWQAMPGARGYNVYKSANYIATVFTNAYIDNEVSASESYYYRIEAFDFNDAFTRLADGLTLKGAQSKSVVTAPSAILDNYDLVFNEEFSGTELDSSKWDTAYLWGDDLVINQEEQHYVDILNQPDFAYNPFVFSGETMTIRSIRTPADLLPEANQQPYLSGVITSYSSFKFTYGYVEVRARMPRGKGFWAAFWLLNAYYVERKPEIDIVEHIGHEQDRIYHTYHYYDNNDTLRSTNSLETAGIDFTNDFHTFGVEWKPGTLIYYVDGVERHRIVDPSISSQEMYIIANTAVGGWWPGSPDSSTQFPGEYEIDYIRVYQKRGPADLPPQSDPSGQAPVYSNTRTGSPNHRPAYVDWPEGYPYR